MVDDGEFGVSRLRLFLYVGFFARAWPPPFCFLVVSPPLKPTPPSIVQGGSSSFTAPHGGMQLGCSPWSCQWGGRARESRGVFCLRRLIWPDEGCPGVYESELVGELQSSPRGRIQAIGMRTSTVS